MTSTQPLAGIIGLAPIHGPVGKLIEIGEWLNGDGFGAWEHAFVSLGNGLIVEAEPGGARVSHVDSYPVIHWCSAIASLASGEQLQDVADAAKGYVGTPYSFLDYSALVAHKLHIPAPGLKKYVASTGHMICSQLADQAYLDAGVHLFNDGRWPGYVTPLALFDLDARIAWDARRMREGGQW